MIQINLRMLIKYKMLSKLSIISLVFFLFLPVFINGWCRDSYIKTGKAVTAMAVSRSGKYLAVGHNDNYVRVYHADNYVRLAELNFGFTINSVRFSPDGYYLAVGGADSSVKIYNGFQPFTFNKTFNPSLGTSIAGVDFVNNSGTIMFVGCGNNGGTGKIGLTTISHTAAWTSSGAAITLGGAVFDCRASPFNNKIAVDISNRVTIYDSALTNPVPRTAGFTAYSKLVWDPLADFLMYIDTNGNQLFSLNVATGTPTQALATGNTLFACDFSPNGKYIATGGNEKKLFLLDSTRMLTETWLTSDQIKGIAMTKDENTKLFVGDILGQILVLKFNCSRSCPPDYYFSGNSCQFCADVLPKCVNCFNSTICDRCVDGFYVDPNDFTCKTCTMFGCLTCKSASDCSQCHTGFYKVASGSVNICKRCSQSATLEGCAICNSSSICIACNNDYYLDTANDVCKSCSTISNCLKCNNGTTCTQCVIGYWKNGNTCSACNANCLACEESVTNCTQCPRGWYVDPPTSYTCTRCQTNCLSCNNSNFCFECANGFYQKTDGTCALCEFPCTLCDSSTVCYACAQGYFHSGTTCTLCSSNCSTCNQTAYCTTCLTGYFLTGTNTCKSCPEQYPYCETCSGTACLYCHVGYFLNGTTLCQHCSEVMFKCEKCSSDTVCLSCLEGFYHTGNAGNASCKSCEVGCQTCIDSGDCRKCYQNYYLDANLDCIQCTGNCIQCTDSATCLVCQEGYYLDGSTCKLCKVSLSNCLQCSSNTVCVDCDVGFYLDSSDKKCKQCTANCSTCDGTKCSSCLQGFYLTTTATPTCQVCSQACTQCTTATACHSCKSGFWLDTNVCKNCTLSNRYCRTCNGTSCYSCVSGYYLDSTVAPPNVKCVSCLSKIEGCHRCNASNFCQACNTGYYLDGTTKLCVKCTVIDGCEKCTSNAVCQACGVGFFLNASNLCQVCKIGCSSCDAAGNCFACSPGFYKAASDCLFCKDSMEACSLCNSSSICTQCMNGYFLVAGTSKCSQCRSSLVGCLYCNNSATCTNCQPGFYLDATNHICETCSKPMVGCDICTTNALCKNCENGYFLNAGGNGCTLCSSSLNGCISCTNINTCLKCKTGYYLGTDSKCHLCLTQNNGCLACIPNGLGSVTCQQCSTGFYLDSVTNKCAPCGTIGCQLCDPLNPTTCLNCDSTYFKSGTSCTKCSTSLAGCNQCVSSTQCLSCDVGYYLDIDNRCKLCQQQLNGCGKCLLNSGVLECTSCKSSYILQPTTKKCSTCFSILEGCTYCINSTECISCSNGYFKDPSTNLCKSCTSQPGCLLCQKASSCDYCSPSYFLDHTSGKCVKCSDKIEFCLTCLEQTRCLSCQSGYLVNEKFQCEQVTVTGTDKVEGMKLITEYIDKDTLGHTLLVQNGQYSNIGYDLSGMCNLYLTDYNQLAKTKKISQIQLTIKNIKWLSPNKLQFFTNNPTQINSDSMAIARRLQTAQSQVRSSEEIQGKISNPRLLQSSGNSSSIGNFKVSLQMNQEAINNILPNLYQTGDLILDYSLDQPQFYMSYLRYQGSSSAYYSFYGYCVIGILIINFIIKTYKIQSPEQLNNHFTGQILSHILAFKSITLFTYPITTQLYYFCYGFMTLDFPWLNMQIGNLLGQRSDTTPRQLVMYFTNLNMASTYALSLCSLLILLSLKYLISQKKQLARNKYQKFVYGVFMFGLTFAGCLALQGAFYNPLKRPNLNALFYLIGIVAYVMVMIEVMYSVYQDKKEFYKVRIFIKATLLSIAHTNPIIVVSISIILDILLTILQFIIVENAHPWSKFWLINHLLLNGALSIMFVMPNSSIALMTTVVVVSIVVLVEIVLNLKLMTVLENMKKENDQKLSQGSTFDIKQSKNLNKNLKGINQSHETFMDDKQINKFNFWNGQQLYGADFGSLHDIAMQQERIEHVRKDFREAADTKYTSFEIKSSRRKNAQNDDDTIARKPRKQRQKLKPIKSTNQIDQKKIMIANSFKLENSSNSSPNEQSVGSNEEKPKTTKLNFLKAASTTFARGRKQLFS